MVFFPQKNSKFTKIQWSPLYDENSAEGFNKWPGRSVLHNRTGLSTLRTLIKSVLKSLKPVRWPNSDLLLIPWFILLLASICCNTKTLEAEKFLSSSQIFLKKSNFQCNWPVLDCTWSYQVQSNWSKYQVQCNLPSTKYFLPSYM